jgi:NADPH2 dehydrogenase
VEAWSKVFQRIHDKKSSVFVQLWALGRMAEPEVIEADGYDYVSDSNVPLEEGARAPRSLTRQEIKQYVPDYVQAAKNASLYLQKALKNRGRALKTSLSRLYGTWKGSSDI